MESFPPSAVDEYKRMDFICGWDGSQPVTPTPGAPESDCHPLSALEKWQIADSIGRYLEQRGKVADKTDFDRVVVLLYGYESKKKKGYVRPDDIRDADMYLYLQGLKTLFGERMPYFEYGARHDFITQHAFMQHDNIEPELFDGIQRIKDERYATISVEKLAHFGWKRLPWNEEETRYEVGQFNEDEKVLLHLGSMAAKIPKGQNLEDGIYTWGRELSKPLGKFLNDVIESLPPSSVVFWDGGYFAGWTPQEVFNYLRANWPDINHAIPFWVKYKPAHKVVDYLPKDGAKGGTYAMGGIEATLNLLFDPSGELWRSHPNRTLRGEMLQGLNTTVGYCDECVREMRYDYGDWWAEEVAYSRNSRDYFLSMSSYFDAEDNYDITSGVIILFPQGEDMEGGIEKMIPWSAVYPSP